MCYIFVWENHLYNTAETGLVSFPAFQPAHSWKSVGEPDYVQLSSWAQAARKLTKDVHFTSRQFSADNLRGRGFLSARPSLPSQMVLSFHP